MGPATARLLDGGLQIDIRSDARCHRCTQIYSPKGSDFVAIEHRCNHNAALSDEWPADEGISLLEPGRSQAWNVEIDVTQR